VTAQEMAAGHGLKNWRGARRLQRIGWRSATWYQPTAEMLGDALSSNPQGLSSNPRGLSSNPRGLSSNPQRLSRDLASLSRDPDSLDKAEDERKAKVRQSLLAGLSGEVVARVGAQGRRSPPDAVRGVILALLRHRDWRLEELGQLLQRNPEYIRQTYVQPLLEAGRIHMTRPDVPNDPEQAYLAGEGSMMLSTHLFAPFSATANGCVRIDFIPIDLRADCRARCMRLMRDRLAWSSGFWSYRRRRRNDAIR
jgi:ATP-dependent DNA helicase RecG